MRKFFREIRNDKTITLAFFLNGFFIIAVFVFILFSYNDLPPFIPIFNQLPWGEQRLGTTIAIFIPVLVALLIFLINIIISSIVYKKVPLIARMLSAISLLIGILTFLFIIKTILLIS